MLSISDFSLLTLNLQLHKISFHMCTSHCQLVFYYVQKLTDPHCVAARLLQPSDISFPLYQSV